MHLITKQVTGLALIALSLILSISVAQAADTDYADDYPGLRSVGGVVNVAESQVRSAISAFQLVYGRNPQSWSEVTASGLFDNELSGFRMESIDPDDASIDFEGDIYLETQSSFAAGGEVLLFNYWNRSTMDVGGPVLEAGSSYADRLLGMQEAQDLSDDQRAITEAWLGNEAQLIQFGHVRQLLAALYVYQAVHGSYPESLAELIETGVGPLKAESVNPLTGLPYRFDGSRGDLSYQVIDDCKGYSLSHVDLNYEPDFDVRY